MLNSDVGIYTEWLWTLSLLCEMPVILFL